MQRGRIGLAALMVVAFVPTVTAQIQIEPAFSNLSFTSPVDLQDPGDGTNRLFVVEQAGVIRVFENDAAVASAPIFLDIQSRVASGGERGLLGLVFDPDYATHGFFYVSYTAPSPLRSVIARFEVMAGNPNQGDPNSELILLEVDQPFGNHNGGQIAFGPNDGYLYVGFGDGGSGGDPFEHGQNPQTLLATILRLDVAGAGGSTLPQHRLAPDCGAGPNATYNIPADNPLADGPGNNCDEIWAYGLRNPWRFSFDPSTGRLWTGDVGQGEYEEVDVIQPGGNYGWNTMEGFHCFDPPMGCDQTSLNLPVWEYPHDGQGRSVTGGYVYRGPSVQALLGQYVYADFIDGRIWALAYDGTTVTNTLLLDTNLNIAAFGVDAAGELYLCAFDGAIYRFTPVVAFAITLKKLIRTANNTKKVKIRWDPAEVSTNKIDFYVDEAPDGTYLKRTFDDGNHKLKLKTSRFPGDGPFSIQACEKNSTTACSNILTADFVGVSIDLDEPEDDPEDDETLLREDALADVLFKAEPYPNPFNPSTTIRFTLREGTPVRLEVFDVIGRRVAVLIDRSLEAGDHDAVFEAGPLPGGVYLYRIQAGNTISLGRMTLLR